MSFERITIDDRKMGGLPCIRDLRIPVSTVIGQLAAGRTHKEILTDFPDLEEADIVAALGMLAEGLTVEEILQEYPQLEEADIRACIAYGALLASGRFVDVQ